MNVERGPTLLQLFPLKYDGGEGFFYRYVREHSQRQTRLEEPIVVMTLSYMKRQDRGRGKEQGGGSGATVKK